MKIKVAPSILSADFSRLGQEIKKVERAGADMLHIDVMDGHFVPNITIGPAVVARIRAVTRMPLDVHLMIEHPQNFVDVFLRAGSDMITVHIETISSAGIKMLRKKTKRCNVKLGISLNPNTKLERIKSVLEYVDFVLVMSVHPGFSGQAFIPAAVEKISKLRAIFKGEIAVDGGVSDKVASELIRAGANILAAGSYIFGAKNIKQAILSLKRA